MLQNKWIQALAVLVGTVLAGLALGVYTPPQGVNYGAYLVGATITVFAMGMLLAHIPAVISRLFSGKWPDWQIWLSVPAIALVLYFINVGQSTEAPGGQNAVETRPDTFEYWFSEEQCDLAARFPGRPELKTNSGSSDMKSWEARYNEDGFHLRAECAQHSGDRGSIDWADIVENFMAAEGLEGIHTDMMDALSGQGLSVADGQGHKIIDGTSVAYRARLIASDQSFMVLYVGGKATEFPPDGAGEFLNSYRKQ